MLNQAHYIRKMLMSWKTVNKFIAKNITLVGSQIRISCIPYERPKSLNYVPKS